MDNYKEIFELFKEAVIAIEEWEIVWTNRAAEIMFSKAGVKEKVRDLAVMIMKPRGRETVSLTAPIEGMQLDMVISYIGDTLIVSVLPPDERDKSDVEALLCKAEESARSAISMFNMASGKLRPAIEGLDDATLSVYAAVQSHSQYLLAHAVSSLTRLAMTGTEIPERMKSYFNIVNTCQMLTQKVQSLIKRLGLSIEVKSKTDRITFFGSEELICLALMKLISNSIKNSKENGNIRVCVYEDEKNVMLSVKDDGVGIPQFKLNGIFEFFKMNMNSDKDNRGLGLGLFTVKQVAAKHGGNVFIESREKVGTSVTMALPKKSRSVTLLRSPEMEYIPSKYDILMELSDVLTYTSFEFEEMDEL